MSESTFSYCNYPCGRKRRFDEATRSLNCKGVVFKAHLDMLRGWRDDWVAFDSIAVDQLTKADVHPRHIDHLLCMLYGAKYEYPTDIVDQFADAVAEIEAFAGLRAPDWIYGRLDDRLDGIIRNNAGVISVDNCISRLVAVETYDRKRVLPKSHVSCMRAIADLYAKHISYPSDSSMSPYETMFFLHYEDARRLSTETVIALAAIMIGASEQRNADPDLCTFRRVVYDIDHKFDLLSAGPRHL